MPRAMLFNVGFCVFLVITFSDIVHYSQATINAAHIHSASVTCRSGCRISSSVQATRNSAVLGLLDMQGRRRRGLQQVGNMASQDFAYALA